jgi:hypothetical protein
VLVSKVLKKNVMNVIVMRLFSISKIYIVDTVSFIKMEIRKSNIGHFIGLAIGISIMLIIFGLYLLTQEFWAELMTGVTWT